MVFHAILSEQRPIYLRSAANFYQFVEEAVAAGPMFELVFQVQYHGLLLYLQIKNLSSRPLNSIGV